MSNLIPQDTAPFLRFGVGINDLAEVIITIRKGQSLSDAIIRSGFNTTSLHCPGYNFVEDNSSGATDLKIELSNLPRPRMDEDGDWVESGAAGAAYETNSKSPMFLLARPFRWMRVRTASGSAVSEDVNIYIISQKK